MPRDLIQLNVRKSAARVLLVLFLIVAAWWSYYVCRWYLGNTMAEYFDVGDNNLERARMAASLAPGDPLPLWRLGQVYQQKLRPDQIGQVVAAFEKAVSLSPNDYRFWMALGTAREQSGDPTGAELALRQAVALAPSYSYPHWYLGNLLLRNARYDEAFAELQRASEADPELRPQLFNFAWQIFGNDFESLKRIIGQTPAVKAAFALYLLGQGRFEDGLAIWNSIRPEEKKANRTIGESIVTSLVGNHRFHDAMNVWNDLVFNEADRAAVGHIVGGGFEEMSSGTETIFGWRVQQAAQTEIKIDPQVSHNGSRSLRLFFQVRSKLDVINVSELVPVMPESEYDFEYYLKTRKLQSGATPEIHIVDASTGSVLVASEPAPNGDNDWNRIAMIFKTGAKTEAITVRFVRGSCDDSPVCPIFGAVWYDDFSIKRRN